MSTESGHLYIPKIFSLTDESERAASFQFLGRLFDVLYNQRTTEVRLDYERCERIDVDASICMDVLLQDFFKYFRSRSRQGIRNTVQRIIPVNYAKPEIIKILFSIGAFTSIYNIHIPFSDVICHRLQVGCRKKPNSSQKREVDITRTVEYVLQCLQRMGRQLTEKAESQLYKVIGEVMINAEEHATTNYRYSIGYFQESGHNDDTLGVLQLVIMNMGDTIYEKFKDPCCPNQEVVRQMQEISEEYTRRNWFHRATFEEESLWTLYALQEGVTSHKDWKRGNGSIRFIDSFFSLKGDNQFDSLSSMTIISGNTRIIFDGTYQIVNIEKPDNRGVVRRHKVMPFNRSETLREQPDKNFVKFVPDYFPGTLISAKICIKPGNTAPIQSSDTPES